MLAAIIIITIIINTTTTHYLCVLTKWLWLAVQSEATKWIVSVQMGLLTGGS